MKTPAKIAVVLAVAGSTLVPAVTAAATPVAGVQAASRFYPLLGRWKGKGQLSEPGHAATPLKLTVSCAEAASGWAVHCNMVAGGGKVEITESDLFGVDAATGVGHWYAITNQGEANDLVAEWADAKTMNAHCAWTQDGKQMEEKVTFVLPRKRSLEFRSVVTADGKEVSVFSGELTR